MSSINQKLAADRNHPWPATQRHTSKLIHSPARLLACTVLLNKLDGFELNFTTRCVLSQFESLTATDPEAVTRGRTPYQKKKHLEIRIFVSSIPSDVEKFVELNDGIIFQITPKTAKISPENWVQGVSRHTRST